MTGFSSQGGHVAFMTQTAPDTFPANFATNAIAMKLRTGALGTNRDLLTPDPEIGGGRDVSDSYLGAVSWGGDYEFYPRFNALLTLLYAAFGNKAVSNPGGTSEVQTLTITGDPTGGTFTLTFDGQTTAAIPYNASAATIQAALEALSNIAPGDVWVTGGDLPANPIVITFSGTLLGDVALITADGANLSGGTTPDAVVAETVGGIDYVGAAVHTFWPSDAAQLPFLAIEEKLGGGAGLEVFHYTDAVVNTLHLEADANGYLMGSAGIIARKQVADVSPLDPQPLYDNLPLVVGTNVTVTYNSVSLPAKTFSMDFDNAFEDDDFRLGSFYLGSLVPKRRDLTYGFTIRESDSSLWRQASYGASGATEAGGTVAKQQLVITMATYETIPGTTPTLSYTLRLINPYAILEPYSLQASGDDIIESDITMRALRPFPHLPLVRAEVITPKSTVN